MVEIFTANINLTRDSLGMTSDWAYIWRLLIEEYGPEIMYIKSVDNTVADVISQLDYNPTKICYENDADSDEYSSDKHEISPSPPTIQPLWR